VSGVMRRGGRLRRLKDVAFLCKVESEVINVSGETRMRSGISIEVQLQTGATSRAWRAESGDVGALEGQRGSRI
jgi:hypothetical protein